MTLSFAERERQREIDYHNRLLLGQLMKIEKDMTKQKRLKKKLDKVPNLTWSKTPMNISTHASGKKPGSPINFFNQT